MTVQDLREYIKEIQNTGFRVFTLTANNKVYDDTLMLSQAGIGKDVVVTMTMRTNSVQISQI